MGQNQGLRATVVLHVPIDPILYPDRKALTQAVWLTVANGAATLRQNRPPSPIASEPYGRPLGEHPIGQPAIAV